MKNPSVMTDDEIKHEMEGLRYKMEVSVHRRHSVPEVYARQEERYMALDDERYSRR